MGQEISHVFYPMARIRRRGTYVVALLLNFFLPRNGGSSAIGNCRFFGYYRRLFLVKELFQKISFAFFGSGNFCLFPVFFQVSRFFTKVTWPILFYFRLAFSLKSINEKKIPKGTKYYFGNYFWDYPVTFILPTRYFFGNFLFNNLVFSFKKHFF